MDAVHRSIPLGTVELPDEFFPAHLPLALIDAVFRFPPAPRTRPETFSERYCRHFRIARQRMDPWTLARPEEQETLEDLGARYDELGVTEMADAVFETHCRFPATTMTRAEYVCRVAHELRRIGVNVLQHVQCVPPERVDNALRSLPGHDERLVRMLLTYAGDENFVRADLRVRTFVARALGRRSISAVEAVRLVRRCAHEKLLSPRFLGHQIWSHANACSSDAKSRSRHRSAA